jgi:hypothetical protein
MKSLITQSKQIPAIGLAVAVLALGLLSACEPSKEKKAQWAEEMRVECLDKFCEGDNPPKPPVGYVGSKLNQQWFFVPEAYGNPSFGSMQFYWPSKAPGGDSEAVKNATEVSRNSNGSISNFYDIAIEIFLRSNNFPQEPRGYHLIELAEKNNWIDSRKNIRSGLDAITMKHVIGPRGQYIDHVTYYVATQFKGLDGLPPVATCNYDHPANGGGTGFMWQPGIWLGTRMNQKHCADWPEIYQEIARVLTLLKKV